jgi:hypothetical protein
MDARGKKLREAGEKCNDETLHNLYSRCSLNFIKIIKLGNIGWAGHVAHITSRMECMKEKDG